MTAGPGVLVTCGWDEGLLRRLLREQARVVALVDRHEAAYPAVSEVAAGLDGLLVVDSFDSVTELAVHAVSIGERFGDRVTRVVGLTEDSQLATGYVAELLGQGSHQVLSSVRLRDKRAMKAAVRRGPVPVPQQVGLRPGITAEELTAAVTGGFGWPAVVKPVAGVGTRSTAVLRGPDDVPGYLAGIGPDMTLMVEQYIDGAEYHVDATWIGGEPRVFGVARYRVPRVAITHAGRLNGSAVLARGEHQPLYHRVEQLHRQVNEQLGIRDAITHLEVFEQPDGTLWFSEIAARVGGGGVNAMYELAGIDLRSAFAAGLTEPAGSSPATRYPERGIGWVHLAPEQPGRVVALPDETTVAKLPYLERLVRFVGVGDLVTELTLISWLHMAVFGYTGWDEYCRRADEITDLLRIRTEPVEAAASSAG